MNRKTLLYTALIAVCFLYAGSAYMSQFYRLTSLYDGATVDIITSGWNYLFQAIGIAVFCIGLFKCPRIFGRRMLFFVLLISGAFFMALSQLSRDGAVIVASGYVFNLHIGMYLGFYLTMLSAEIPAVRAGLCYGIAYAAGSIGTYLLSLADEGRFLMTAEITWVYIALAVMTAVLVMKAGDIRVPEKVADTGTAAPSRRLAFLISATAVMMVISVLGSGLYYSVPQAKDVDWNLIRAFYSIGLVAAGFIMDRSRLIGGICAVASLTYPLIVTALIGEGVAGTTALALSYLFRGFITIYYVIMFTDLGRADGRMLPAAALGMLVSRATEAGLSMLLIYCAVPEKWQFIISAVCFVPLLILMFFVWSRKTEYPNTDTDRRDVFFADRYRLTSREAEILGYMSENLTDDEIAEKCYISRNTVRFHISNILKKTGSPGRVDAVRKLKTFR